MKILHICQRDDPSTGGSLRVAEALVREQRKAGLDAWVLFLYGEPAGVSESLAPHTLSLGLESSREAFRGIWILRSTVRKIAPDIIHSHDGILWPRLSFLCNGIPVVMHSHLPIGNFTTFKDRAGRLLVKETTDLLIGISLHTIETWVRSGYPASKINYVPNGVDFERFQSVSTAEKKELRRRLDLPAEKRLVLWVGRLHESVKGTDRVERIAAILPDHMAIVVVGTGPSYEGMRERCQAHIAAGRIILTGSASTPELYYKAADFFLFTSYQEAFGLVILEAVASELPLIVFPVTHGGGAVQLLREFSTITLNDSNSDSELHTAMESLCIQGEIVFSNREKAFLAYSLSAVSKKVVDVYKIALNSNI